MWFLQWFLPSTGSMAHGCNSVGIIPLLSGGYPVTMLPSLFILSAGCLYPHMSYSALLYSHFNPAIPISQLCPPQSGTKLCVLLTHCHVSPSPVGIHLLSCPHPSSFMPWGQGRWGHSYQTPYLCCHSNSPVGSVSTSSVLSQLSWVQSFPQTVPQVISHCASNQPSSFRFSLTSLSTFENGNGMLAPFRLICSYPGSTVTREVKQNEQALLFSSKILLLLKTSLINKYLEK